MLVHESNLNKVNNLLWGQRQRVWGMLLCSLALQTCCKLKEDCCCLTFVFVSTSVQCQSIESPNTNTKVIKKKQEENTLVGQGKGVGRCCFVELASQPCCKLKYKSLSTTTSYWPHTLTVSLWDQQCVGSPKPTLVELRLRKQSKWSRHFGVDNKAMEVKSCCFVQ